ncbi:Probable porphobilinogen deaminase [Chlamydiales bacterium SCGC AG-110-P3]|nr:Probable porphobilinogen deaminase [Chlamydiales bacterium SCGC AG-110-P3]
MLLSSRSKSKTVSIAARDSTLSQAQVVEVLELLKEHYPKVSFDNTWLATAGDRDQETSLRNLDKTDFFTRDLDEALLAGRVQVTIHSAKDLPEPLKKGISVIALTHALDPRDMLVPSKRYSDAKLPKCPVIGTSSARRERTILDKYPRAIIKDIRGSIPHRLEQLDANNYDAVVMPECALLRLNITERPRTPLHGAVAPLQGQLAITARTNDSEMANLFACIDTRE